MLHSELIQKITTKSKHLVFNITRGYKAHGESVMPYEELIVVNEAYPDKIFLIHKNMIFNRGLEDTSYSVWSFDLNGELLKQEDVEELGNDFFMNTEIIHKII